jgi:hypothetical protein
VVEKLVAETAQQSRFAGPRRAIEYRTTVGKQGLGPDLLVNLLAAWGPDPL